jgi:membrane-associated phospholipid phosphatase
MEHRAALFTVAIPLIAFKVWFAILLLTYAPTRDNMVWIAATHWPLVIIVGLLIGPGIAVYRLMRARARRERFRRAEFLVAPQCSALWETVSRLEGGD